MNCKIKKKHKKVFLKFLGILLLAVVIIGGQVGINLKTQAAERTEPSFSISNLRYSPEKPIVGEDITVTGTIVPNDFVTSAPENDIVLVLDVSGSMNDPINVKCTNKRVGRSIGRGWSKHWSDDYCEEHGVEGEHTFRSTKLKELKKAAINFIDKMQSVPNVKIGIVVYSDYAWVNPDGVIGQIDATSLDTAYYTRRYGWIEKNYVYHSIPYYHLEGKNLLDINNPNLHNMINGLVAAGGTNTGEGIRKGIKLLEDGSKDAKKTIVLMSDGLPTFYSVKDEGYDYYTEEDFDYPDYRGTGNSDEDEKCLNYATTIGTKVKEDSFNVFTIGYGLNYDGNNKLKEIHNSMTNANLTDDTNSNEENGFFAASDSNAIDSVFNTIGNKIIDEYSVNDGFFHDGMIDDFELSIGSEKVSIPSMKYKKVEQEKNGEVKYHCEPYEFSIVIKGSKSGEFENIFDKSYISFSWEDKIIKKSMLNMGISIDDNKLPNIKAELTSEQKVRLDPNMSSQVTYKIDAENFQYEDAVNQYLKKDIVILLDTSSGMDLEKMNQLKDGEFNSLLFDDVLKARNTKYCIITYDSTAVIKNPDNEQGHESFKDDEGDTTDLKQNPNKINELVIKNLTTSESPERNIGDALEKAADVFDEDKEKCDRYLLLVSSGGVSYTQQNIDYFKNKVDNFKVLSLAIENDNGNSNPNNFLYNIHKDLAGAESAQLANDSTLGNSFVSSGKDSNTAMSEIAQKIKNDGQKQDYVFNVSLKFNLGNDIDSVSGLTPVGENYYTVDTQVIYKYNSEKNQYEAEPVNDITFEVKPNKVGQICKFGSNNIISYNGITDLIERNIGKTPEFTIDSEKIQHGIYQGGNYNIDESNNHTYYKGSMATMGIKAEVYGNEPLTLTIGNNATIQGEIKIYNMDNGRLVGTLDTSSEYRNYRIPIIEIVGEDKKNIFVLYTVKINNDASGKLTNRVTTYTGTYKDADINIGGELPDLF